MLLNIVLKCFFLGVLLLHVHHVKSEKRLKRRKLHLLKPFHHKQWQTLEKHKYQNVFKTHKYLTEEKPSSMKKDSKIKKYHRDSKKKTSEYLKKGVLSQKKHKNQSKGSFKKHGNQKLSLQKKHGQRFEKKSKKNAAKKDVTVQRGFLDALKNANISVQNSVHSYTTKSNINSLVGHQKTRTLSVLEKALQNANISVQNSVHSYTTKSHVNNPSRHKKNTLSALQKALQNTNISVENHVHSQTVKSNIKQGENPDQRGFLDALKNTNISVQNSVHSYTTKSNINSHSGHQKARTLSPLEKALQNANISVQNSVHSYTTKSHIIHPAKHHKKNTLSTLEKALQNANISVQNSVHSYTTKSHINSHKRHHMPKDHTTKRKIILKPHTTKDVTGSKRDEMFDDGIQLHGDDPIDVAGEIDSNDKNLIPILTKASTRELELENLHDDREEEKHDDEQESEYVVSDKDNFPAENDPDYTRHKQEEREHEHEERLKKESHNIHEDQTPSEDRFDIGENRNFNEERQENSRHYNHDREGDSEGDENFHGSNRPPLHGAPDLHNHGFPINSYVQGDINRHTSDRDHQYMGRHMYKNYDDHGDNEDRQRFNDHENDRYRDDDRHQDEHRHHNDEYNHHSDTPPPRHGDPDIEGAYRYHPRAREHDEDSSHHGDRHRESGGFSEGHEGRLENSDHHQDDRRPEYESLIAAGGRHSGPAVSLGLGMHGYSGYEQSTPYSGSRGSGDDRIFGSVQGDHCVEKRNGICHDGEYGGNNHHDDHHLDDHHGEHHLTKEERMIQFQRNPFDPHDIDIDHHHDDDEHHHEAVMSPIPQSVLQIGVDPSNHIHYLSRDQHHDLHYDNSLFQPHVHGEEMDEDLSMHHNPHEEVEGEYAAHSVRVSGHDNPHEYETHEFDHPAHDHIHETTDHGNTDWDHHRREHGGDEYDEHRHHDDHDGHAGWAHEGDHHGDEHHEGEYHEDEHHKEEHGGHEGGHVSYEQDHTYPAATHQAPYMPIFTPPQRELPMFQVGHVHHTDDYHNHHASGNRRTNTLNTGQTFDLDNRASASDMTHFLGQYLVNKEPGFHENLLGLSNHDFGIEAEIARKRKLEDDALTVLNETEILKQLHDNTSDITIMDALNTTSFDTDNQTVNNTKTPDPVINSLMPEGNTTTALVDSIKTAVTGIRKRVIPTRTSADFQTSNDDVEDIMGVLDV
ncbi:LIM domain-containing protein A-like isoform X2 [Hydractinia symbiolongicarpus]|uniref:LIM domain-containing protein A-like isoform X2 n=1 Tax=Hydractinia symbiolongicarpus TaxID=13093 RepID=UPI002551AB4B|nr:LIM domain-containing protein A-like isoform X2 [Hydractinia symbiolongicarpus]